MEQEIVFYLTLCSVRPPAPAKDPDRVCNRSSMRLQPSAPDTWSSLHRIRTSTPSASNDRHSYSGCEKLPPESGSLVRVDGPVGNAKLPGCQGQRPFPSPVGDEDRVPVHEGTQHGFNGLMVVRRKDRLRSGSRAVADDQDWNLLPGQSPFRGSLGRCLYPLKDSRRRSRLLRRSRSRAGP